LCVYNSGGRPEALLNYPPQLIVVLWKHGNQ
jgi:hypothetical protein